MSHPASSISFFDKATNNCPYPAYGVMREEAPVWKDPVTGMFFLTRYDDIRAALVDTARFTNRVGSAAGMTEKAVRSEDPDVAARQEQTFAEERAIQELYEENGWPTVGTLDALDGAPHAELRRMFDIAFRPGRIKLLDPFVEQLAHDLFDAFIDNGRCEWVADVAIPLPLFTIGKQMGVPAGDMPKIKAWTDAWVQRMGLQQTFDERMWSARQEIEAQHYFQPIFERLRVAPEDTVLSDLVNKEIPEWGRTMTDHELHSEMMADLFVGGSETTTNALAGGVVLLIENPTVWAQLKSDPERYLATFIEEVVRLEGPVQGLLRETSEDMELHGVFIPGGSIIHLRYGAANRDGKEFDRPDQLDLSRPKPKSHLGYGFGTHFCLGAPLARRELYWGFRTLVERVDEMAFVPGANDFDYHPNYFLRALRKLHIEFTKR